jgi:DNA-binding MarR family transcriptional regulator
MSSNARTSTGAVAARLHSLAIHLLRRARRDDPAMGLSPARASALAVLTFGGARTIGELAAAEQVTAATMSRLISGLEADGFVTRKSDPTDGRAVRVAATAKGRRALERGRQRRIHHMLEVLGDMQPEELVTVERAVSLLEGALVDESIAANPRLR